MEKKDALEDLFLPADKFIVEPEKWNKLIDVLKNHKRQIVLLKEMVEKLELWAEGQNPKEKSETKIQRAIRQLTELKAKNPKVDGIIEIRENLKDA